MTRSRSPAEAAAHEFPALQYLCWGYFHQDWFDFHASEEAVLQDIAVNDAAAGAEIRVEAQRLLQEGRSETELAQLLRADLDCNLDPPLDGRTWQSFVERLARLGTD